MGDALGDALGDANAFVSLLQFIIACPFSQGSCISALPQFVNEIWAAVLELEPTDPTGCVPISTRQLRVPVEPCFCRLHKRHSGLL